MENDGKRLNKMEKGSEIAQNNDKNQTMKKIKKKIMKYKNK